MPFIGLLVGLFLIGQSYADSFCFAQAQSYYEQVYCEVEAQGKGKNLPRFDEFKRNNPITQALLLKHPADSAGITVVMPKMSNRKDLDALPAAPQTLFPQKKDLSSCQLQQTTIACGQRLYELLGNRINRHLKGDALEASNRLNLPVYRGTVADRNRLYSYLLKAYQHYIYKMIDIGLSGATMSYGTFEFLFSDLHDKGVNFHERFETMYQYLKQDKQNIRVDERIFVPEGLSIQDCGELGRQLIACVTNNRNYLFRLRPAQ